MTGAGRRVARWVLRGAVVAVVGLLVLRVGTAPFLAGLQRLTAVAVLAALALTAAATVLSAWRWTLVSRALGVGLPLRTAVSAYYRSQLLNSVLPGGMTGDLERGLRTTGPGRRLHGLRVVGWDRGAAQVVQLAVIAGFLLLLGTPLLVAGTVIAVVVAALLGGWLIAGRRVAQRPRSRLLRAAAAVRRDLRRLTRRRATLLVIIGASALVTLLHASVFMLAAVVTGAPFDPLRLLPLALAVQAAMAVPVGFGGLGPREGMAAAVFTAAGLGAGSGVSAAVAYGALALIAVLPGLLPLTLDRLAPRRTPAPPDTSERVAP
jgi:glycosyltransferase 2 family protein